MEILKKLKKRICPFVLAVVIFTTSVVSGPASLTAQAASFSVTADTTVEFVMMLYNIFETISIASGMKDGLDDYSKGMTIFEAFISFIDGLSYDPFDEFTIYGPDGTALTRDEFDSLWESAVGDGKLKSVPDEKTFAKYRVISGGKADPSPSPDPSSSPEPTTDPKLTRAIRSFAMGTDMQFQRTAVDFLTRVQNNAVPEVDPAQYYNYGFDEAFDEDSDGNYLITGKSYFINSNGNSTLTTYNCKMSVPYVLVQNNSLYSYFFYSYDSVNGLVRMPVKCHYINYNSFLSVISEGEWSSSEFKYSEDGYFNINIPMFDNIEHALNFCQTGNLLGLINGMPYDYHSMTAAAPDTLENLSGTNLDPEKLPAMNNAMKEAANDVEATGTDKEANNAEMIAAIKAAVAEALAEAQPDPSPTTAPDSEPSVAPDPGTDTDYTGILGLILAAIKAIASGIWNFFSNPMGIITNGIASILELFPQVNALIQALPAAVFGFFQDPLGTITSGLTNLYNGVLRIIEIFPEQVQLVLGNIADLPAAMLQVFTDPLGAIQSLLGLLPSWANLQSYLDKILQALLDPVSALQPSDPGGTDPGGSDDDSGKHTPDLLSLLNGLILLIMILLMLLRIFLHCLQFIVGIFKIQATPGFLPDEMVMGLNYLKTLEITGIGMSVYDFMMGLVYIFMVFGVIKLLRGFAFHIHIPKGGSR